MTGGTGFCSATFSSGSGTTTSWAATSAIGNTAETSAIGATASVAFSGALIAGARDCHTGSNSNSRSISS